MTAKKKSVLEIAAELIAQAAPPCVICTHPERADLEALISEGAAPSLIAKILEVQGLLDVSTKTAADKVSNHRGRHMKEPIVKKDGVSLK